jgi:hypothetical protein
MISTGATVVSWPAVFSSSRRCQSAGTGCLKIVAGSIASSSSTSPKWIVHSTSSALSARLPGGATTRFVSSRG